MVVGRLFCLAFVVISFSLRAESSSWWRRTGWSAPRAHRTRQT